MALTIVKAESVQTESMSRYSVTADPSSKLIHLVFSDGSEFHIYPESEGDPRTYAHDLLDEYLAAGGTIA